MKEVTKYIADDGAEFTEENACILHEKNCMMADAIMYSLPARPDGCDFSNGSGYIQHDSSTLLETRNKFLEFVKTYTKHKWIQETIDGGFDVDTSWAGRIIGESAPNSIYAHWHRFGCIDKQCREWGQPYYAANPSTATNEQLN